MYSIIACHWGGLVTIPIAAQATSSQILHVIRNSLLKVLVIDKSHLDFVLQLIDSTSVEHIIVISEEEEEESYEEKANYFDVTIHTLDQVKKSGQQKLVERSTELCKS